MSLKCTKMSLKSPRGQWVKCKQNTTTVAWWSSYLSSGNSSPNVLQFCTKRLISYGLLSPTEGDVPDDGYGNTFILTGKSEHINLRTVRPPSAPTNLGVLASTCHSVMVGWDPPHESGIEIIGEFTHWLVRKWLSFIYNATANLLSQWQQSFQMKAVLLLA